MESEGSKSDRSAFKFHLLTFLAVAFAVTIYSYLYVPNNFHPLSFDQISQFDELTMRMLKDQTTWVEPTVDVKMTVPVKEICELLKCRASGGNCNDNKCVVDGGWSLKTQDYYIPDPVDTYSWERENQTNTVLENLPNDQIPFIFHRSWKKETVPKAYDPLISNCNKTHPNWHYLLWTDTDNWEFIRRSYPEYLYIYQRFQKNIERADFTRYLYMYHYGGLYVDLDVDCLKNSEELIKDKIIVLGKMGADFPHNIPNAIMYSRRNHPFWLFVINLVTIKMHQDLGTEATTGPVVLKDAYELFRKIPRFEKEITVTEPGLLYGVDWRLRETKYPECGNSSKDAEIEKCRAKFPNAYLITYWAHSWNDQFTTKHPE